MPILIGVSPLAVIMKGEENCAAAIAAPDFRIVRRLIDQGLFELAIQSSRKVIMSVLPAFFRCLGGHRSPTRLALPIEAVATFGLLDALTKPLFPVAHQCFAAAFAASLLSTISASTATPVFGLIRNGLTSIEAIRLPASAIRLDKPTSAFTTEGSCSAGLPR